MSHVEISPKKEITTMNYIHSPSKNHFSPNKMDNHKPTDNFTCRSGFSHHTAFDKKDEFSDVKLEFVKEDIAGRGRYEGYKANEERNGHGILYFNDGGHYEGEWKDDKMHGFGKLYYENGTIAYEGHW
jgi:hypothetical protein